MPVFGNYARYYDLLYKDKDYADEAEYVCDLIKKHCPKAKNILDLGCGTGKHDFLLAQSGFEVTGVDQSEAMLTAANAKLSVIKPKTPSLSFRQGDIRTVRLRHSFDVIIALFHVISYQTTNNDLQSTFDTVREHLNKGGIFIFDCWYGPAVLTDRPATRVKRLEDEAIVVTRIAEPTMFPNDNQVAVDYHIFVRDKNSGEVDELRETHRMRYLFQPEVELLLQGSGMAITEVSGWMTKHQPGFDTWGACFVVKG